MRFALTPDEVHRLCLGPGTPVAMHLITGFTEDGRPVRVAVNIPSGDRHAILWERARPPKSRGMNLVIRQADRDDADYVIDLVT